MRSADFCHAGWIIALLAGCVWCAGCRVEHPAARAPSSHLLSIDFRPDNPKLIDVRVDGELLVTINPDGERPNWDPLQRRMKELRKKADAGGQTMEIKVRAGERVPYEAWGSALLCGGMGGFYCDVRGGKDVELVLWRPASEAERSRQELRRILAARNIVDRQWSHNPEPELKPAIRVDLLGDGTAEGVAAGRYTIRVGKSTMAPEELQAALEDLRKKDSSVESDGDLCPVLIASDMGVWYKSVLATCRAARVAGFKEIYFLIPK